MNINPDLVLSTYHNARHIGYHAIKLNILKSKQVRYESQRFLTRCLEAKITRKGLVLGLEPTTGNHVHEFLDNWFDKLKSVFLFSDGKHFPILL